MGGKTRLKLNFKYISINCLRSAYSTDSRMFNHMDDETPITAAATSTKTRTQNKHNQHISDIENSLGFDDLTSIKLSREKLTEALREACLPKLLCEMAAKPNYSLNDRERDLLSLIKWVELTVFDIVEIRKMLYIVQHTHTRWHWGGIERISISISGCVIPAFRILITNICLYTCANICITYFLPTWMHDKWWVNWWMCNRWNIDSIRYLFINMFLSITL